MCGPEDFIQVIAKGANITLVLHAGLHRVSADRFDGTQQSSHRTTTARSLSINASLTLMTACTTGSTPTGASSDFFVYC